MAGSKGGSDVALDVTFAVKILSTRAFEGRRFRYTRIAFLSELFTIGYGEKVLISDTAEAVWARVSLSIKITGYISLKLNNDYMGYIVIYHL